MLTTFGAIKVEQGERVVGRTDSTRDAADCEFALAKWRSRFYQGLAETLVRLRAPKDQGRLALTEIVSTFATTMHLPLAWVGWRRRDAEGVTVLAAAGAASDRVERLLAGDYALGQASDDPLNLSHPPGLPCVVRAAGEFVAEGDSTTAWHQDLLPAVLVSTATRDGGQLVLATCTGDGPEALLEDIGAWLPRLAEELARFWDHQAAAEHEYRIRRYRDAQRTIQRALLEQPDPDAVYRTLARSLVEIAGAAAVDVHVVDGDDRALRRVALVGPIAEELAELAPAPPPDGGRIPLPILALRNRKPQIRIRPSERNDTSPVWQQAVLSSMGACGCWPIVLPDPVPGQPARSFGVFTLITVEQDAFDEDMCNVLDELAEVAGLALHHHELRSAQMEEQRRQTYLAMHDPLTGLPNRRALDMHLESALERAERSGRLVAAGLLDLDDLKPINDRLGHATGDLLLVEVARRLRGALRPEDYVARLGGDEFVIVCEGLRVAAEIEPLLNRLWLVLREPMLLEGEVVELAASLGIALFPDHATADSQQLLRRADQAMYQVKARKRQRDRWWSMPLMPTAGPTESREFAGRAQSPYGSLAVTLLESWSPLAEPLVPAIVDGFIDELSAHDGIARLFSVLPQRERVLMAERFTEHVRLLIQPGLDIESHRSHAVRAGRFHASAGLEEVWLLDCVERLRDLIAQRFGSLPVADRRPLDIVLQRLGLETQWQLESMRELQRERVALLARLNALAWSAEGYLDVQTRLIL